MGYYTYLTGELDITPDLKPLHANILEVQLKQGHGELNDRGVNFEGEAGSDWQEDVLLLVTWLFDNDYTAEGELYWDSSMSDSEDFGILSVENNNQVNVQYGFRDYSETRLLYRPVAKGARPPCPECGKGIAVPRDSDPVVCSFECMMDARRRDREHDQQVGV